MTDILEKYTPEELLQELHLRRFIEVEPEIESAFLNLEENVTKLHESLKDIDSSTLFEESRKKQKVIYGVDDRQDLFNVKDFKLLDDARCVCSIWRDTAIVSNGDGTSTLNTTPFNSVDGTALCQNETFRGQPKGANCSGFLVTPNVIATAGHCLNASNVTRKRFVFGFRMNDANSAQTIIDDRDIYQGVSLLGHQLTSGIDWALVQLDREVANHKIADIRRAGKVADNHSVHVIGHPVGLPIKVAGGANVRDNTPKHWFIANLDTYGGNSGSPVFNSTTHQIEGILVRGDTDFESITQPNGTVCIRSNVVPSSGGRGEDCTRTLEFASLVPVWRHLSYAGSSAPGVFQNYYPGNFNYEVFVRKSNHVQHYWWNGAWQKGQQFGTNVTSEPAVLQNHAPGNFNYEVVVQEGSYLQHYWWNGAWQKGQQFGTNVTSEPVMFQNHAPNLYNYELLVREGDHLQHYWFSYGGDRKWHKGKQFGSNVKAAPTVFQNYAPGNVNYEVVVEEDDHLQHYWWNGVWQKGQQFGAGVTSEPVMFQNHAPNLYNYELLVREGNHVQHYWFSYGGDWKWHKGQQFG